MIAFVFIFFFRADIFPIDVCDYTGYLLFLLDFDILLIFRCHIDALIEMSDVVGIFVE